MTTSSLAGLSGTRQDRRIASRYDCEEIYCLVSIPSAGRKFPAQVRNVSVLGIGLETHAPLAAGSLLDLTVYSADESLLYEAHAVVSRTHRFGADRWLIGCTFTHCEVPPPA